MPNCFSKFLNPPQATPALTLHEDDDPPYYVLEIEVQLDAGTTDQESRAQVIPENEKPCNDPPDEAEPGTFNEVEGSDPWCYFSKVFCRKDVNPDDEWFKLVVWYQCDGKTWSHDDIDFKKF